MQNAAKASGENVENDPQSDIARFCRLDRRRAGRAGRLAGRGANSARGACRAGRARTAGRGVNGRAGRMCSYLSNIFDILSSNAILNKNLTCESSLTMLG